MSSNEDEKLNKIENLKNKLFSRGYETISDHPDHFTHDKKREVLDSWKNLNTMYNLKKEKSQTSIFKKFFIFSVVFFMLALGYVSYMFFVGGNTVSNSNIDINIIGNTFTNGGEKFPLVVEIVNKNKVSLQLVDLVVEYPKGSTSDIFGNTERLRSSVGTIASGGTYNENIDLFLFGEQGTIKDIKFSLEYRLEGSNAIFVKDKNYEVTINSTPLNIAIEAPEEVTPGQDVILNIKATLNAPQSSTKMLTKLDYPLGFQFVSANPAPAYDNNVWDLGEMTPGVEKIISITGKMVDVYDGDEKTFRIFSGLQSGKNKSEIEVVFNSLIHKLTISKPFIDVKLLVNSSYQKEYSVSSKSSLSGQINWANNLDTKINDLNITARIKGNVFDRKTLNTRSGFYNSVDDYLVWDKNSIKEFAEVNPGGSGSVDFSFMPMALYSATGGLISNPSVVIEVSITGKQALEGNILRELKNSETKNIKIISDVGFNAKSLYYSGPFKNTGPIPPKAEKETTYTITWSLSNTSNNISKVEVRSALPQWMRFTGEVSPASENIIYDASTREILWKASSIPKGAGITTGAKEVSFQVALTPSISQVGEKPTILNKMSLTGYDDFANVNVQSSKPAFTTSITSDPLFLPQNATVVE